MPPKNDTYKVITDGTFAIPLVPALSILGTLIVGAVTATLWITTTLWDIKSQLRDATKGSWHEDEQREYSRQLQQQNPTIRVPDPELIRRQLNPGR